MRLVILCGLAVLITACQNVQPWEKSTLAKPRMHSAGTIPEYSKTDQHVYTSKESAKGGLGVGGGGCGCN
jgi:hypothetical protein